MAINKVDLTVSQLLNDLNEGFTWLKKDDLGYGSIEAKYGANEKQILAIRKHPKLKDAETNITVFNIIDDTNETTNKTSQPETTRTNTFVEQPVVSMDGEFTDVGNGEAADIFAQL